MWERDNDPRGFEWIDGSAADTNIFSWLRWSHSGQCIAFVANFSPVVYHDYPLALPKAGLWQEVLNTDAQHYGGSGVGNQGQITALATEWNGRPAMARITVPPLSATFFTQKLPD
jgi:1,4-alpha-glucan branching enzyme